VALEQVQRRLSRAPEAPWLHAEVARRMAQRLPIVKLKPQTVVDWSSFLGARRPLMAQAYPQAQRVQVELSPARLQATREQQQRPWWTVQRWTGPQHHAALPADLPPGAAQLVWANMALHAAADPQPLLRQWHRALAQDGFLMFSTLGPGSLVALQRLFRQQGWGPAFAPMVDMHDLGDMLIESGFADPVMDQEILTLTWAEPAALLAELRQLGGNAHPARHPGLRTPRWRQELMSALHGLAERNGRIALEFEIVYGHAFKPLPKAKMAAQTLVPLEDLRAMARRPRRGS